MPDEKIINEQPKIGQPGIPNGEPLEVLHTEPEINGPPP